MGGSIFKHDGILGGIFPGFMWDPYRVTLELLRDPNAITLSSAEVIMIIKCQVSVSSLLFDIKKAKERKITSAK